MSSPESPKKRWVGSYIAGGPRQSSYLGFEDVNWKDGGVVFLQIRHMSIHKWVFPKIRVSQNGWFIMENPIKIYQNELFPFQKVPSQHYRPCHVWRSTISTKSRVDKDIWESLPPKWFSPTLRPPVTLPFPTSHLAWSVVVLERACMWLLLRLLRLLLLLLLLLMMNFVVVVVVVVVAVVVLVVVLVGPVVAAVVETLTAPFSLYMEMT